MNSIGQTSYRLSYKGNKVPIHPSRQEEAHYIDKNRDGYLSNKELLNYNGVRVNANRPGIDKDGIVHETKVYLQKVANPDAAAYHSYAEVGQALRDLEKRFPDQCQRVSLGESAQGRQIWALKVSDGAAGDTSHKTGVVITGCTHAREWMTVEVPLYSAEKLLESAQQGDPEAERRLRDNEVWFVPLVNPDGYEYSRKTDNMWRKNRRPIEVERDGQIIRGNGVDPNRNYGDEKSAHLYRPKGDTPGSLRDDREQGADDPRSEVFRGTEMASEREVKAMLQLELGNSNIRGVIDYHSYGETILFPNGHTRRHSHDHKQFVEIGERMNQATGGDMLVQQGIGLYPTLGTSEVPQYANGIFPFTFELNGCFQPDPSLIQPTCERMHAANMVFIDEISERAAQGRLPERTVPVTFR